MKKVCTVRFEKIGVILNKLMLFLIQKKINDYIQIRFYLIRSLDVSTGDIGLRLKKSCQQVLLHCLNKKTKQVSMIRK